MLIACCGYGWGLTGGDRAKTAADKQAVVEQADYLVSNGFLKQSLHRAVCR